MSAASRILFGGEVRLLITYFIISLFMTYPLIFEADTKVVGIGDVWQNLWNMWWVKKVYEDGGSLYYTHYQFYPSGISLVFHTLSLANTVPAVFMQEFLGLFGAYNLLVLLSFTIAGYGMHVLAKEITKEGRAAFIAGILFAYSTPHYIEVWNGHLNLLSLQWLPLAVYYFLRTCRSGNDVKKPLLAAFFTSLTAYSSWQYLGFLIMFMAPYIAYQAWMRKEPFFKKKLRRNLAIYFAASLLLIGPGIYPMIKESPTKGFAGYSMGEWIGTSMIYSAHPLGFFAPSGRNPIYNEIGFKTNLGKPTISIGYLTLLLAALSLKSEKKTVEWMHKKYKRARKLLSRRESITPICLTLVFCLMIAYLIYGSNIWGFPPLIGFSCLFVVLYYMLKDKRLDFWIGITLFFTLLSIGPLLMLPGQSAYPLPYMLFYYLPGFNTFRTPYRMGVMVMLGACVLAAKGAAYLLREGSRRNTLTVCLIAIALIESLAVPFPMNEIKIAGVYQELGREEQTSTLLEIPIPPRVYTCGKADCVYGLPKFLYYQTIHEKRMVGGYISRISLTPKYAIRPLNDTLLFHLLRYPQEYDENDLPQVIEQAPKTFNELDIKYLIYHEKEMEAAHFSEREKILIEQLLSRLPIEKISEEPGVKAYKVSKEIL